MGLAYRRALLKISGEALAGDRGIGLDYGVVEGLAGQIKGVHAQGIHLGLVVGGGNIVRGSHASREGLDRVNADYMGMLATVINALALQDILENMGVQTRVMTAIRMESLAEPYIRRRAVRHLEKGRLVIFAGGTGNPFFSTDTAAVLRALEIEAEVIMKATRVDGVYSADPLIDKEATMFKSLNYLEVLQKNLKVMDSTSISLCMDHDLPILVFNLNTAGNFKRAVAGETIGTIVRREG